jgi:hypothetical protein
MLAQSAARCNGSGSRPDLGGGRRLLDPVAKGHAMAEGADERNCKAAAIAQEMAITQVINVVLTSLICLAFGLLIFPNMPGWLGCALALILASAWYGAVKLLLSLSQTARAAMAWPNTWPGEAMPDARRR